MSLSAKGLAAVSKPAALSSFLPDFCRPRAVFLLMLNTELLALVLAFAPGQPLADFWVNLTITSFVTQWIALVSAAGLCYLSPRLARLPPPLIALTVYGLTQITTLIITLITVWPVVGRAMDRFGVAEYAIYLGRNLAISSIVTLLALRYFYVQHQWQQNVQAEARARLRALQARIHPHFLFNTLNTIAGLIPVQPDCAEQAVLDLADLLRSALAHRESITLYEELELTRRYLAIERLRLGDRLRVDWRLDPDLPLDLPIPALLLQPLVENAIRHGIQHLPEGGTLTIQIEKRAAALRITVVNPQPDDSGEHPGAGQRIAQDNIRQRLQLAYQTPVPLAITEASDRYQVSFILPLTAPD